MSQSMIRQDMQKIHFIGIGGVGLSNIAFFYLKKNIQVFGSDLQKSEITQELKRQGAKIFIGHQAVNLKKSDLVIYSEAIPENNPELQKAKKLNIKCLSGGQAISELSKNYFTIAVSGMHGKTTTCSMIAQILLKAGLDPSYVIGKKNGWRLGKSKYLIIEADEYKDKFLNYYPDIALITNVESEHLDYFKNIANIKKSFKQFASQAKKIIKYKKHNIKLQIPGKHNRYNACLAFETAKALGIKNAIIKKALFDYKGSWRRFEEKKLIINNYALIIIHDYAHHPSEIKATLQAAREKYPRKKIIAIFQPHQYQRLNLLFNDFAKSFNQADKTIITDVYKVPGREEKIQKTGQDLAMAIKNAKYIKLDKLADFIKKIAKPNQVILLMGAGDIYNIKL
ncbi:MAG: UDP-N-acetylmuramate--L-alanine ligase [bacterium]